jgi:hypothetical protein
MSIRMLNKEISGSRRSLAAPLLALAALLAGCNTGSETPGDPSSTCAAGVLEADLQAAPPFGPAVDPETGEIQPPEAGKAYVVSSTYGVQKTSDAARARWAELFGPIQDQLASQPGLLALQLGSSTACSSGRTLAVWESVGQMYSFVGSDAHVAAMDSVDEVVEPGFTVLHWEATTTEQMTFEEAIRRLAETDAAAE